MSDNSRIVDARSMENSQVDNPFEQQDNLLSEHDRNENSDEEEEAPSKMSFRE